MRTARLSLLAGAFALALASVASAQSGPDPCSLLTKAEIKAALGVEIGDLSRNTQMNAAAGTLCDFTVGQIGAGGVAVRRLPDGQTPAQVRGEMQKRKVKTADAPGLAPAGFFAYPGYGMVQAIGYKGGTEVIVQVMAMGMPEQKVREAAGSLAQTAIGRLK